MKRLVVATRNQGKLREVSQILADLPYELVSLAEYPNVPDVEETGSTFLENAVLKAIKYARYTREMTLADDYGLEIDALDGAPGVHSSRFAPTDPERIARVLELMKDVPNGKRIARFRCAIAIAWPDGRVETCEAKVEGIISLEPRGSYGFGYDPIFYIPELGKHMAELEPEEKNAISHRGRALRIVKKMLLEDLTENRT